MPEPIPRPVFDQMMRQAGLPLTEAEAAGIRAATAHLARFAESVRRSRPVTLEPATTFRPDERQ